VCLISDIALHCITLLHFKNKKYTCIFISLLSCCRDNGESAATTCSTPLKNLETFRADRPTNPRKYHPQSISHLWVEITVAGRDFVADGRTVSHHSSLESLIEVESDKFCLKFWSTWASGRESWHANHLEWLWSRLAKSTRIDYRPSRKESLSIRQRISQLFLSLGWFLLLSFFFFFLVGQLPNDEISKRSWGRGGNRKIIARISPSRGNLEEFVLFLKGSKASLMCNKDQRAFKNEWINR